MQMARVLVSTNRTQPFLVATLNVVETAALKPARKESLPYTGLNGPGYLAPQPKTAGMVSAPRHYPPRLFARDQVRHRLRTVFAKVRVDFTGLFLRHEEQDYGRR